jgi:hypothetical protein
MQVSQPPVGPSSPVNPSGTTSPSSQVVQNPRTGKIYSYLTKYTETGKTAQTIKAVSELLKSTSTSNVDYSAIQETLSTVQKGAIAKAQGSFFGKLFKNWTWFQNKIISNINAKFAEVVTLFDQKQQLPPPKTGSCLYTGIINAFKPLLQQPVQEQQTPPITETSEPQKTPATPAEEYEKLIYGDDAVFPEAATWAQRKVQGTDSEKRDLYISMLVGGKTPRQLEELKPKLEKLDNAIAREILAYSSTQTEEIAAVLQEFQTAVPSGPILALVDAIAAKIHNGEILIFSGSSVNEVFLSNLLKQLESVPSTGLESFKQSLAQGTKTPLQEKLFKKVDEVLTSRAEAEAAATKARLEKEREAQKDSVEFPAVATIVGTPIKNSDYFRSPEFSWLIQSKSWGELSSIKTQLLALQGNSKAQSLIDEIEAIENDQAAQLKSIVDTFNRSNNPLLNSLGTELSKINLTSYCTKPADFYEKIQGQLLSSFRDIPYEAVRNLRGSFPKHHICYMLSQEIGSMKVDAQGLATILTHEGLSVADINPSTESLSQFQTRVKQALVDNPLIQKRPAVQEYLNTHPELKPPPSTPPLSVKTPVLASKPPIPPVAAQPIAPAAPKPSETIAFDREWLKFIEESDPLSPSIQQVGNEIKTSFPPEFLNALSTIQQFNTLFAIPSSSMKNPRTRTPAEVFRNSIDNKFIIFMNNGVIPRSLFFAPWQGLILPLTPELQKNFPLTYDKLMKMRPSVTPSTQQ